MRLDTSNPEFENILQQTVPAYGKVKVTVIHADGFAEKRTLGRAFDHAVMIYRKGSKRYGYYIEKRHFKSILFPEKRATENDKWVRSWTNVLKRLEQSGLWGEIAGEIKDALEIGLEKIRQAYDIDNEYRTDPNISYQEEQELQTKRIKEIDERLVKIRDDGTIYPNSDILWHMRFPARVKKMHFGRKWLNSKELEDIANALKNKQKINVGTDGRITNGYDVSYSYNPEVNKAWYSEEYRGCGNGHYYLALDATHALFYEDD